MVHLKPFRINNLTAAVPLFHFFGVRETYTYTISSLSLFGFVWGSITQYYWDTGTLLLLLLLTKLINYYYYRLYSHSLSKIARPKIRTSAVPRTTSPGESVGRFRTTPGWGGVLLGWSFGSILPVRN